MVTRYDQPVPLRPSRLRHRLDMAAGPFIDRTSRGWQRRCMKMKSAAAKRVLNSKSRSLAPTRAYATPVDAHMAAKFAEIDAVYAGLTRARSIAIAKAAGIITDGGKLGKRFR